MAILTVREPKRAAKFLIFWDFLPKLPAFAGHLHTLHTPALTDALGGMACPKGEALVDLWARGS
jgi:hypothetical protein